MKFNAAVLLASALSLAPGAMVAAEPVPQIPDTFLSATETISEAEALPTIEPRVVIGGPGPRIETTLTASIDGTMVAIPTEDPRFEGGHGPRVPLSDNINSYSAA